MFKHPWMIGIGYAITAIVCALAVMAPVFLIVNLLYDGGDGLMRLLIAVPVAWFVLARILRRRRISL